MTPVSGFSFKLIGFSRETYCRHEGNPYLLLFKDRTTYFVRTKKSGLPGGMQFVLKGSPGPEGPYEPRDNRLTGAPQGPFSTLAIPARNLLRGKNDPSKWIFLQIDWVFKGDVLST